MPPWRRPRHQVILLFFWTGHFCNGSTLLLVYITTHVGKNAFNHLQVFFVKIFVHEPLHIAENRGILQVAAFPSTALWRCHCCGRRSDQTRRRFLRVLDVSKVSSNTSKWMFTNKMCFWSNKCSFSMTKSSWPTINQEHDLRILAITLSGLEIRFLWNHFVND